MSTSFPKEVDQTPPLDSHPCVLCISNPPVGVPPIPTSIKPLSFFLAKSLNKEDLKIDFPTSQTSTPTPEGVLSYGKFSSIHIALEEVFTEAPVPRFSDKSLEERVEILWELMSKGRTNLLLDMDLSDYFQSLSRLLEMNTYFYRTSEPTVFDLKFLSAGVILKSLYGDSVLNKSLEKFSNLRGAIERSLNYVAPGGPKEFDYELLQPLIDNGKPAGVSSNATVCTIEVTDAIDGLPSGIYVTKTYEFPKSDLMDVRRISKFETEHKNLHQFGGLSCVVNLLGICKSSSTVRFARTAVLSDGTGRTIKTMDEKFAKLGATTKRKMWNSPSTKSDELEVPRSCSMILQHYPNGDMEKLLLSEEALPWPEVLKASEEMSYAVLLISTSYPDLHVHGDIKLPNFLVGDGRKMVVIDLADFTTEKAGPGPDSNAYTEKHVPASDRHSDLYSLAMCFLRLATEESMNWDEGGNLPQEKVLAKIREEGLDSVLLGHLKGLVDQTTRVDFGHNLQAIYDHGWDSWEHSRLRQGQQMDLSMPERFFEVIYSACSKCRHRRPPLFSIVDRLHTIGHVE